MKKFMYSVLAAATMLFATTSCSQEEEMLGGEANGNNTQQVSFTVQLPGEDVNSRGINIGGQEVEIGAGQMANTLIWALYENTKTDQSPVQQKIVENPTNGTFDVKIDMVKGLEYKVLFFAYNKQNPAFNIEDPLTVNLQALTLKENPEANKESYDAFAACHSHTVNSEATTQVILHRPFAQINAATTQNDLTRAGELDATVKKSELIIKQVPTVYNILTGEATVLDDVTFAQSDILYQKGTNKNLVLKNIDGDETEYFYLNMAYVLAGENANSDRSTHTATFNFYRDDAATPLVRTIDIPQFPIQRNHRTNLIGDLLTQTENFEIVIDNNFAENGEHNVNFEEVNGFRDLNRILAEKVSQTEELIFNVKGLKNQDNIVIEIPNASSKNITLNLLDVNKGYQVIGSEYVGNILIALADDNVEITEDVTINTPNAHVDLKNGTYTTVISSTSSTTLEVSSGTAIGTLIVNQGNVAIKNEGEVERIETTSTTPIIVSMEDGVTAPTTEGNIQIVSSNNEVGDATALKLVLANAPAGATISLTNDITDLTEVLLINKDVTIDGNEHSISSTASRVFRLTTKDINVEMNNLNVISNAVRVYPNDVRGISVDAELENVSLTLNNCTVDFTDASANDWAYAVNVSGNGNGHNVTVNGGTYEGANVINVHGANNIITVEGAELNCLYPENEMYAGACIWVLQNQGSSVVAENNTFNGDNAVAFNLGKGTKLEESGNTDNTKILTVKVEDGSMYYTLAEAIAAIETEGTIKVCHDFKSEPASIPTGKTITLNLNGKNISAIDETDKGYAIITNHGNLTITGQGTMTLTSTINSGWSRYSSVISNATNGILTIDKDVVLEHLGGTDMAYGLDVLTNSNIGDSKATVYGTIKSPYRAIRQFLNSDSKINELHVMEGAVIEGANKSIWMQDPSKKSNKGKLVVEDGAQLNGDVYLSVTAGSEEWPVEVSIAASALMNDSEVLTSNVLEGYEVTNVGGYWKVINWVNVTDADELVAALEAGKNVIFANDIKIEPAKMSNAYGTTGINIKNGQSIDGNGFTLNIQGAGGTWDSGINTTGGLIKNITVTGSFRGIFINHTSDHSEKVVLEKVTITGTTYTISCDQGLYQGIEATNCTFNGWTSFAKTAGKAKFVNCSFGEGTEETGGYKYCRPYSDTEFVKCTFCPGYTVDQSKATVTFTDCTWEE